MFFYEILCCVADPDYGSGAFFTPGSRIGDEKNSDLEWKTFGFGIRNKHPRPATLIMRILAKYCSMDLEKRIRICVSYLDEDWGCLLITDQLNRNPDPQHCFKVPFSVQIISFKGYWRKESITGWKLSPAWRKFWAEKQTQSCSGKLLFAKILPQCCLSLRNRSKVINFI